MHPILHQAALIHTLWYKLQLSRTYLKNQHDPKQVISMYLRITLSGEQN